MRRHLSRKACRQYIALLFFRTSSLVFTINTLTENEPAKTTVTIFIAQTVLFLKLFSFPFSNASLEINLLNLQQNIKLLTNILYHSCKSPQRLVHISSYSVSFFTKILPFISVPIKYLHSHKLPHSHWLLFYVPIWCFGSHTLLR